MFTQTIDTSTVEFLVDRATAAPSMHNAQPWQFRFIRSRGTLQLRMDPARAMPVADLAHRALHLGCGAALFNLRVATTHAGLAPHIELLPDAADPELLADITFTPQSAADDRLAALYPAVALRRTSREPFTGGSVPEALRDVLAGAAVAEGARLAFLGDWQVHSVLALVQEAGDWVAADPEVQAETERWTRSGTGDRQHEGIPAYAFGPRRYGGRAPVRDFVPRSDTGERRRAVFEQHPCLAVLGTRRDRPVDWLDAGQALERVLLEATLDGLSTSLDSQALEWPELRWAVRDPLTAMGHAQMLIRFGYGPEAPATPRRPLRDVLEYV
ncbi:nitroreductase [Streptomyces sp. NBC_00390]|uniref:Acg family FMN-binding oxidoreductase n=1 Tax=Streptomyces sp. NBC_00390 TaxID=2975736 RepID=UPI002E23E258